jgi:hypothetical protein
MLYLFERLKKQIRRKNLINVFLVAEIGINITPPIPTNEIVIIGTQNKNFEHKHNSR